MGYTGDVNFAEAQEYQIQGKYSDLLRLAVQNQIKASREDRPRDEINWTIWVVKACRYVGRTKEGYAHSKHLMEKAEALGEPLLYAEAMHAHALMLKMLERPQDVIRTLNLALSKLPKNDGDFQRAKECLNEAALKLDAATMKILGDSHPNINFAPVSFWLDPAAKLTQSPSNQNTFDLKADTDPKRSSEACAKLHQQLCDGITLLQQEKPDLLPRGEVIV